MIRITQEGNVKFTVDKSLCEKSVDAVRRFLVGATEPFVMMPLCGKILVVTVFGEIVSVDTDGPLFPPP